MPVTVLYRDDHLVAVDKPSGMLVHPANDSGEPVLVRETRDTIGCFVHPVHRLDRGTSGVVVMGLNKQSAAALAAGFERREVHKIYLAWVCGVPDPRGSVDSPLQNNNGRTVDARTDFTRLAHDEHCALLQVQPHTGRPHRIRRHLSAIGHTIIGDTLYGAASIDQPPWSALGLTRMPLHASRIELAHPETGERLAVDAPLPPSLKETGLPRHPLH